MSPGLWNGLSRGIKELLKKEIFADHEPIKSKLPVRQTGFNKIKWKSEIDEFRNKRAVTEN